MAKASGGLARWFKENWVDISRPKKGGGYEPCGRGDADKGKYPKCVPASRAASMSQEQISSAVNRKRRAENKQSRQGKKPIMVSTIKKSKNIPSNPKLYASVKAAASSFKNTSAVVENTKVSLVHNVSKFNPHHDELGRFTSGGAGRRVSRMPKSKSKNKSNAQAEKIVSQLTAKLGKDVADKLKPMILPAIKIWNGTGDSSEEIKVNGKSVSWASSKKNVTAGDIFNIIADELGNEALGMNMSMDDVTNAFRLKSQMPKSGKAKSNARFGLKDTKKMTDDEVMKEYRRLNARKQKLEAELPTISNRVGGFSETNEYGEDTIISSRPYVSNKEVKARIKQNKGLTAAIKSRLKDLDAEAKSRNISSLALQLMTPFQTRITGVTDFSDKIIEKFNPNHDELGRFTFGSGMGAPAGNIKPVEKLASQLKINKDWSKVRKNVERMGLEGTCTS